VVSWSACSGEHSPLVKPRRNGQHAGMKRTTVTTQQRLVDLFPATLPFRTGKLKVSDLHTLHYEECGNPKGKPVVFLHGGPGGGIDPIYRRYFDPKQWRIVLFDQRGCGKSRPFAELRENTTWDLVADIERLRVQLGIERWRSRMPRRTQSGSWRCPCAASSCCAAANCCGSTRRARATSSRMRGRAISRRSRRANVVT
jgi:hypothetical protein